MDQRIPHLSGHVAVGADGSAGADLAVRLAAEEAARRKVPLQVVHAAHPAEHDALSAPGDYEAAHAAVDRAAAAALAVAPSLDVERTVVRATPIGALLDVSGTAALTVVGSRGLGPVSALLVGSVGLALAAHARGPVLIARGEPARGPARRHPVVVGVAGPECRPAVEEALRQAARRGVGVRAVHAWSLPLVPRRAPSSEPRRNPVAATRAHARDRLTGLLDGTRDAEPNVRMHEVVVRDAPARALVGASEHAELLVVAARRRPPGPGMHLGPVTHAVLSHAHCPVLVVPVD
ncbi:universal stress protein [Yinghuangia sp. ASG 101]|uniref:universal stress protein n=1 Tax=Yinghuangia sp. ASG 101 TaxID=2896848 RepID=UPI001E3B227F|nr:universal stress protein [Yinghuangia sp. ASG 101]UGQ11696.1 universal stress protein [Yinghuangia sp. ASG 101]